MEYLKLSNIIEANKTGISDQVKRSLCKLESARKYYPGLIMEVVKSGALARQLDLSTSESCGNSRISSDKSPLADTAGAYFFNEEIIGGSREKDAVNQVNQAGKKTVPGWPNQSTKLKLGPGVGLIEAPSIYPKLLKMGMENPDLTLNYTAPNGTSETRRGIKSIMDSRIDPEGDFFPESGVFVTEGATEGIDLFMEALAKIEPGSRAVFLGLSYYTGPYSAFQKGLKIDRLAGNPARSNGEAKFFPTAREIESSLPKDTKALVVTIPNNPNGETYSDQELTRIVDLAKRKNLYILFDGIFENMYFDEAENYRSRLLQIAAESAALDRVVVVDSLSKTKNFAGERIGFVAATDKRLIDSLENTVLSRRCNPRLTLGPILSFEGLARKTKRLKMDYPSTPLESIAGFLMDNQKFSFGKSGFLKMYQEWATWDDAVMKYYRDNLAIVRTMLDGTALSWSPDRAAFNTFVKVADAGADTNSMDFLAKLMYTTATYTQVGPCFGISQKTWDNQLGVWPRITYASSRNDLTEALTRLVSFTQFYQEKKFGDPNRFPQLQIKFDTQV